jgi:hypothetical protein
MMDTSPEYIKMCEKAKEIQRTTSDAEERDFFTCSLCGTIYDEDSGYFYSNCYHYPDATPKAVWLPRQDQLQEIYADHTYGNERANNWATYAIDQFSFWVLEKDVGFSTLESSFEQLWLAFVMKEKFNKTWTGEEWTE